MIDFRAVGGGPYLNFSEDLATQNSRQDPSRPPTEEIPLPGAFSDTSNGPPELQAPWPSTYRFDDPFSKSMTLLRFRDDDPGTVNTTGGTAVTSPPPSSADITKKINDYFAKSENEYTLPDGSKVKTQPSFRMNSPDKVHGDTGQFFEGLLKKVLKPVDDATKRAIHMVAYGRGTPDQIRQITQAIINKNGVNLVKKMWEKKGETEFKNTYPNTSWPLSDADAVKLLQSSMGIGVDCAGYVQQELLAVHGGSRAAYGLQSIGDESLTSLKGNKHFKQVGPDSAEPGDLMILDAPPGERVGHTVMIQDRHTLTAAERASYPGMDAFAKPNQNVQVFTVEASFGGGSHGDPTQGGVQRRLFFYNQDTKKWADLSREWDIKSEPSVHISNASGPYNHPMNGIFHPTGK